MVKFVFLKICFKIIMKKQQKKYDVSIGLVKKISSNIVVWNKMLWIEMKTNNAHNVFPFAVFPQTLLRRFMISMLYLNLFQNDYISKRLDILYIKPICYLHTITYTVWM